MAAGYVCSRTLTGKEDDLLGVAAAHQRAHRFDAVPGLQRWRGRSEVGNTPRIQIGSMRFQSLHARCQRALAALGAHLCVLFSRQVVATLALGGLEELKGEPEKGDQIN